MNSNVKVFALVSAFATLCITVVSLYAINRNAAWAAYGIVVGIFGACITIAVPVASAISVRIKKGREGASEASFQFDGLPHDSDSPAQQAGSYTFSLAEGQPYHFNTKLFGADRYAYTFTIGQIWVMDGGAKFALSVTRHGIGEPPQVITNNSYGLQCGENVRIDGNRWLLTLESSEHGTARFRVLRT